VVFSVDLFNEGVDLPSIDTVMMLRPTESKILFLQQLGRGLRRSEGKQHLVVLDFIGNHHSFLQKPQALFGVGSTYQALAAFARKAERHALDLPAGLLRQLRPGDHRLPEVAGQQRGRRRTTKPCATCSAGGPR
jgi:superfamily II DNA or RNA helicase